MTPNGRNLQVSKKFLLVLLVCIVLPIKSQIPGLGDQPYFRGLIAGIPKSNSQGEFLPSPEDPGRPLVTISDGVLRGFTLRTINNRPIYAFQSIPYAEPPTGPLRFANPVKNKPWTGIRNALPQSPPCAQLDMVRGMQIHGQEDCLYLNVYTPQQKSNDSSSSLPVMVWIHGGGFFFGAGSIYGPRYLLDRDVVLVTVNYRLGPFGFFSTGDAVSPGNQGLKDQVLALQWVQANIAAFQGNPSSVTLFGQSTGGTAVGLHVVSPLSRGLFHRAIEESSSAFCSCVAKQNASEMARKIGSVFKCPLTSSQAMVDCLRRVFYKLLAPVQVAFENLLLHPLALCFGPTVEPDLTGAFMTKTARQYYVDGEAARVPVIMGLNSNEFSWAVNMMILNPINALWINSAWEQVGPSILGFDNSTEDNALRVRDIWNFYMGDRKLSWKTRREFVQLYGDRIVTQCTLEAMRYHSFHTKQPVYAYRFSFQGRYSMVQQTGGIPRDWGVDHMDEVILLLNNPDYYASLKPTDSPDTEMSTLLTTTWANFAANASPTFTVGNGSDAIWQPIEPATDIFSPLRFLDLNLDPKMMADPFAQRYQLWRQVMGSN